MEDRFNPNLTYRFVIFFSMGDNDAVDELGPERVVVKSFTIGMTEEHFSRLIYLDDHTDGAWTRFWQKTAWKFGQLGECTDPAIGLFGFDTSEIDTDLQQNRLMRVWKWLHRRHGYMTGPIETMTLTPEEHEERGEDVFAG